MGIGAAAGALAVATIGGSLISSNAATSAADKQSAAALQASQNASNANAANVARLEPYNEAGQNALASWQAALGIPGATGTNPLTANGISGLTFQPTQAQLEATPGYKFNLNQGLQATQNANAATGRGVSGDALKGAAAYATGLANNTLTTQQGIFQQNLANVLNPLQSMSTLGENAAAQTGSLTNQGVANANNYLIGGANAQAAGAIGSGNAFASGLNGIGNAGMNYALYNQLLGGGGSSTPLNPGAGVEGGTWTVYA